MKQIFTILLVLFTVTFCTAKVNSSLNLLNEVHLPTTTLNLTVSYSNTNATLSWTNKQENNVVAFEIQRSFDGITFAAVATINAATTMQQYEYTDKVVSVTAKNVHYKIRVVLIDGSNLLSDVVSVNVSTWDKEEMVITPSLSSGKNAQIKVKIAKEGEGKLVVVNAIGKIVLQQQTSLQAGANTIVLKNITSLEEGYYTVKLSTGSENFSTKLLIWQ